MKKIKVTEIDIIVAGHVEKPYYELKYREVGKRYYCVGYSSYYLRNVVEWKEKYFEVVKPRSESLGKYSEKLIYDLLNSILL